MHTSVFTNVFFCLSSGQLPIAAEPEIPEKCLIQTYRGPHLGSKVIDCFLLYRHNIKLVNYKNKCFFLLFCSSVKTPIIK